jgi:hypothetical protein
MPPAGFGGANGGGAWVAASSSPPRVAVCFPGRGRATTHANDAMRKPAVGPRSAGPNLAPTLVGAVALGLGRASQGGGMKLGGAIEAHPTLWIADEALGSSLRVGDESFTVKRADANRAPRRTSTSRPRSEAERDTSVAGSR